MNKKEYKTADLNLAIVLYYFDYNLKGVEAVAGSRSKKLFLFTDDGSIKETVDKYTNKELRVDPLKFYNSMKLLKTLIHEDNL